MSSSLWDKAHGGKVGGKRQVWIRIEGTGMKRDSTGSRWRLHHSPRSVQGEGSSSFAFQRAFPAVQMAGGSLPRHLFSLISSQGRESPLLSKSETPSKLLKVGDEQGFPLTVTRFHSLRPVLGWFVSVTLGTSTLPHGLLGSHCLRLSWNFLVRWVQSGDNMLRLSG